MKRCLMFVCLCLYVCIFVLLFVSFVIAAAYELRVHSSLRDTLYRFCNDLNIDTDKLGLAAVIATEKGPQLLTLMHDEKYGTSTNEHQPTFQPILSGIMSAGIFFYPSFFSFAVIFAFLICVLCVSMLLCLKYGLMRYCFALFFFF